MSLTRYSLSDKERGGSALRLTRRFSSVSIPILPASLEPDVHLPMRFFE